MRTAPPDLFCTCLEMITCMYCSYKRALAESDVAEVRVKIGGQSHLQIKLQMLIFLFPLLQSSPAPLSTKLSTCIFPTLRPVLKLIYIHVPIARVLTTFGGTQLSNSSMNINYIAKQGWFTLCHSVL
jgi:hypothetical protein